MALTEREEAILRLKAKGLSDYKFARRLNATAPNIIRFKIDFHNSKMPEKEIMQLLPTVV
jgi:DNA-binding CsgD family transcriptional regulator